jgi:hypothetical protein
MNKRKMIIAKIKTRYLLKSHKFGIEFPKFVKAALAIDEATNTTYWKDAIVLEIKNVYVAFQELENGKCVPIGYQQIRCHIIFDVKVCSIKRKARYVAGGHETEPLAAMTYASVVSKESV